MNTNAEASTHDEARQEKFTSSLKNVIQDAEDLLKLSASDASAEATALRERVRARLHQAKDSLLSLQETATQRARQAGRKADEYVHEKPWHSVGIAAGVGMLIGLLIGRR